MRGRSWIVPTTFYCAAACTPTSDPVADATSAPATESSTATTGSSSEPATTEPEPPGTTETSAADTSSTGGACGCPPDTPRAVDDQLASGSTAADAIAAFDGAEIPFEWSGYAGLPTTSLRYAVTYAGGLIEEGPGGDDGCSFMAAPCSDGVTIEVELHATTDDGWLEWTAPGVLRGRLDETMNLTVMPQDIATNAGTLVDQPYELRGIPAEIATIELDAGRHAMPRPMMWATLIGQSPQVSGVVLGNNL